MLIEAILAGAATAAGIAVVARRKARRPLNKGKTTKAIKGKAVATGERLLPCDPPGADNAAAADRVAEICVASGHEVLRGVILRGPGGKTMKADVVLKVNGALIAIVAKGWPGWISADKHVWTILDRERTTEIAAPTIRAGRVARVMGKVHGGTWTPLVVMTGSGPVPAVKGVVMAERLPGVLGGIAARNPRSADQDAVWWTLWDEMTGADRKFDAAA